MSDGKDPRDFQNLEPGKESIVGSADCPVCMLNGVEPSSPASLLIDGTIWCPQGKHINPPLDSQLHPVVRGLARIGFPLISIQSGSGTGACVNHNVEDILTTALCARRKHWVTVSYTDRMLRHPPAPSTPPGYYRISRLDNIPRDIESASLVLLSHGFVLTNVNLNSHCLRSLRFVHDNRQADKHPAFGATAECRWHVC